MNKIVSKSTFGLFLSLSLVLLVGCGHPDYSRTKDGLMYKIIKGEPRGEKVQFNKYLKINQEAYIGDSLIYTSFGLVPAYGVVDSTMVGAHDFTDILPMMYIGDSAVIERSIDTLVKRGVFGYTDVLKKGNYITIKVKVLAMFPDDSTMYADKTLEDEKFKDLEINKLAAFVKEQQYKNVEMTPEGVYVVMEKEGTGAKADSGTYVSVKYTGRLKNGKAFDSNQDSNFGHTDPFEFQVGSKQVIDGWDIGIQKLKAGSKAKIIIPSFLGYGDQAQGERLPAYSDLIFDIEVLSVKSEK